MISLEHLLVIPCVDQNNPFDISPDGTTIAYSSNISGKWELYLLPIDRSDQPQLVQPGPGNRFTPKFSPVTPELLMCVVDYDGSESYHLLLCDLAIGESIDLTPGETLQPNFSWSPDGRQVAFISNRTGIFDVYLLDLPSSTTPKRTETARHAGSTGHPIWDVCWSPDGNWLACSVETEGSDYGIYLISTQNEDVILLGESGIPINASEPDWSPDGSQLIFRSTRHEYYDIGAYNIETGRITWITDLDGDDDMPVWDTTGTKIAHIHNDKSLNWLVVQELNGSCDSYKVAAGMHSHPRFTRDSKNVIVLFENPHHPPNLWRISLESDPIHKLTNSASALFDDIKLIKADEIQYPGLDDAQVPALLFRSASTDLNILPAAVVIAHGGPNWHISQGWDPFIVHLVSRGWIVLAPNYRGSTGYGRTWQNASYHDMGGIDTNDVAAGTQYLVRAGLANPLKIAITGRSHGGFLTMSCLTRFPNLWAAGSGVVPFFDWVASHYAAREDLQHWNIHNMGDPIENKQLWYERSPLNYLEQVCAPVQIICGGIDPRCPAQDSISARDRLQTLGKQVDFLLYPDEGHTFLKKENILDAETSCVNFLARYL